MTNLPTSGGSYTRDDKGALKPAGSTPKPAPKPEKKDAEK